MSDCTRHHRVTAQNGWWLQTHRSHAVLLSGLVQSPKETRRGMGREEQEMLSLCGQG